MVWSIRYLYWQFKIAHSMATSAVLSLRGTLPVLADYNLQKTVEFLKQITYNK